MKEKKSKQKKNVMKEVKDAPNRFKGPMCPLNVGEQKDRFLKFGITPTFILKENEAALQKLASRQKAEIRFDYLNEARNVLEKVKAKFGDGSAFIVENLGEKIEQHEAAKIIDEYLIENRLVGEITTYWTENMTSSARMMWHGLSTRYNKPEARKYTLLVKNSSENIFLRERGIKCLADHELGTHYFRMYNDGFQPWFSDRKMFGLRGRSARESTSSEEGLASVNTLLNARYKYLWSAALLYYTACMANEMSFKSLFNHLITYVSDSEQRWKHVMRVKRGLKDPSENGGCGSDQCYFEGAVEILKNIDNIDFLVLHAGKICSDETQRVKRLARLDCIRVPHFLKDMEKYKRQLRQIAFINGLVSRPQKKVVPQKPSVAKKSPHIDNRGRRSSSPASSFQKLTEKSEQLVRIMARPTGGSNSSSPSTVSSGRNSASSMGKSCSMPPLFKNVREGKNASGNHVDSESRSRSHTPKESDRKRLLYRPKSTSRLSRKNKVNVKESKSLTRVEYFGSLEIRLDDVK